MDLGYINTRVKAWRGGLFTKEGYKRLLYLEDTNALINALKASAYGREIEIARSRFGNIKETVLIDHALKENLFSTFRTLWDDAPLKARPMLNLLFSIWEVYNLKTIMRGIEGGINPEKIYSSLLPVGELDESALMELIHQRDIFSFMQLLHTWGNPYSRPLKASYSEYLKTRSLLVLELAMDRFIYPFLVSSLPAGNGGREIVFSFLADKIDIMNIMNLLKVVGREDVSVSLHDYYISGGKRLTGKGFFLLSVSKDEEELLKGLKDTLKENKWFSTIERAVHKDMNFLEMGLEDIIIDSMRRKALIQPLSIAVLLHYVMVKYREIKRLKFIMMAKEFNIPSVEAEMFLSQINPSEERL